MAQNDYITSANGREFIAEHEGEVLKVYLDPVGLPTLGVGHLLTAAERKRMPVGTKISKAESQAYLAKDLETAEDAVRAAVKVPITQNQFDALVSFTFNVGAKAMRGSSVIRRLNARDFTGAANAFLLWNKAGGKVQKGLVNRRKAERELFLTADKQISAVKQTESSPKKVDVTPKAPQKPTTTPTDAEPPIVEPEGDGLPSMDAVQQQIPRITQGARWLGGLASGGILSTTYAALSGYPPYVVFGLGMLTGVVLAGLAWLFVSYYKQIFSMVKHVMGINADPTKMPVELVSRSK